MQNTYKLTRGKPYPLGASVMQDRVNFAAVMNTREACGIILYDRKTCREIQRLSFDEKERKGNIRYGALEGIDPAKHLYNFYRGESELTDPYARAVFKKDRLYSCFLQEEYCWEGDRELRIAYQDSIFYLLHVKGFTRHRSSGVEHRGTFTGIMEKIPYLKELGITALELMPAYEFDESLSTDKTEEMPDYMKERYKEAAQASGKARGSEEKKKINYWGYQSGYYFAPKRSYAAGEEPERELKDMVKMLHQNGIEVIMQFYFLAAVKQGFILEVLKYWVLEYHIDGIHIKGERIPITLLATEPLLADVKLLYHDLPLEEIYEPKEQPIYRNLAFYKDDFMYDVRKFLKGDDNQLQAFTQYQRRNPQKAGIINFITNYYGFTLMDLVSYDRKHNESNGEDNRDGTDYNFSWNCGEEGKSRRKAVLSLRRKQMKNALAMVFLAQGTPLLRAGDEFMQTQNGNNNPYCQDNETTWLKWDNLQKNQELFTFVKELIALRRKHPVLRQEEKLSMADTRSCGYPDLSLHGEEAWKPGMENYSRHIGMMYCGSNASDDGGEDFIYIAWNMHWQKQRFALPRLSGGMEWSIVFATGETVQTEQTKQIEQTKQKEQKEKKGKSGKAEVLLEGRSVAVFAGRKSTCISGNILKP